MTPDFRRSTFPTLHFFLLSLILSALYPAVTFSQTEKNEGESEFLSKATELPAPVGLYQDIQKVPESVRRSAPFARMLGEMVRRGGADGVYDFDARVAAFEQSKNDLLRGAAAEKGIGGTHSPLAAAWTNIGLVGTSGQGVFSAGCITAIAVDPVNTNTIYAGATSGGVWKTTDQGGSWVELTDLVIPNLTVASLAIDPKHHNTIYVGTGNGYASIDELAGSGIYRSTDGGGSWSHIATAAMTGTISKVLIDPVHSNIILATRYTTNRGVYRSTDSGATWARVFPASGYAGGVIWDMVSGAVVGGIPLLYFVEGNNPGGASQECGVYESVNEGTSWSKITTTALPRGDSIGRCAIAASVADPSRIFVLMANPSGDEIRSNRALFRSTDKGGSWNSITTPSTLFKPAKSPGAQGWYDCVLGVTPYSTNGHDTIYVGGIEGWANYNDPSGWNEWSGYEFNQDPIGWASQPHVDQHCVAFDPGDPNIMYVGCDGGLYWSQDAGYNWEYRSNQMVTGRVYHIGLSPTTLDTKTTLVGLQDQGTWKIVAGSGTSIIDFGDGMQPITATGNTTYPYFDEQPNGVLYRYHASINNWEQIDGSLTDAADWNTPFTMSLTAISGISSFHIFYTGRTFLWRTTSDGSSWTQLGTIPFSDFITSIGLSQVDSRNIYVGLGNGLVELTTNSGTSWTQKLSTGNMVSSIVTNGHDTNFVLASFYTAPGSGGARVMRSTNKGTTWTNVSGSVGFTLPLVGVNCVALDSANPLRVWYAATDNGMYYTQDSGATWGIAGAGIGLAPCRDVQVQKNGVIIRVGTFGRGIWEGSTNTLPVELSSLTYTKVQAGTVLSWHTDSERGDAGFYVQRSINGGEFQDVTFVPSLASGGTSNIQLKYSFLDSLRSPGKYLYQLKQVDLDGTQHFSNHVEVQWGNTQMTVYQNYPNPLLIGSGAAPGTNSAFNPFGTTEDPLVVPAMSTHFVYELPDEDAVSIKIYNSLGKFVAYATTSVGGGQPVNGLTQEPGTQDAFWDGHAEDGAIAPSGAYFYVIESQKFGSFVNKMMLLTN